MIDVGPAVSDADFVRARGLLDEMAAWDAAETRARGIASEELVRRYYSDPAARLLAKFTAPGAGFLLCRREGEVAGCVGFGRLDGAVGELQKLFVRPIARGRGVGAALMTAALAGMVQGGYARARLETVDFMNDAIELYRRFGFVGCPPFREPPAELAAITVFMEREL